MKKYYKHIAVILTCLTVMLGAVVFTTAADDDVVGDYSSNEEDGVWTAAWGTGMTNVSIMDNIAFMGKELCTRSIITPTASGSKIRIKFSNIYGQNSFTLTSVNVAKSVVKSIDPDDATSEIDTKTIVDVTFNGKSSVTIPKGAEIYCDPIDMEVKAMENIAVSMYAKDPISIRTMGLSGGTTYLAYGSNKTKDKTFENSYSGFVSLIPNDFLKQLLSTGKLALSIVRVVPCIATIDVLADEDAYSIGIIGDSTVANEFPLFLAEKINSYGVHDVGVLGKGIIGNMLCGEETGLMVNIYGENILKRFDRDIAAQANVKYVVVKICGNDIIHPVCIDNIGKFDQPTSDDLIDSLKIVCDKIHEMGAKAILCTITQWKGTERNYFNTGATYIRNEQDLEADWQIANRINQWIKTTDYHDGYVDLAAVSGPSEDSEYFGHFYGYYCPVNENDPLTEYSSDGIHPTKALQKIWADAFSLDLVDVKKRLSSIKLSNSTKLLGNGNSFTLSVSSFMPNDAFNKDVAWTVTSGNDIISIVPNGSSVTVKGIKNGTATVSCKALDGSGVVSTCTVNVATLVSDIVLSKNEVSLYTRKSIQLAASAYPVDATNRNVVWSSSNTKVAKVNEKGLVEAVGSGTAYITCKSADGAKSVKCKVTVIRPTDVTEIDLNKTGKTINVGNTYKLKATVYPTNATYKDVQWKTSKSSVATVSSTGVVKAVSPGTAYITCKSTDNPSILVKAKITVVVPAESVKISKSSVDVYQYDTQTLKATVLPKNTTNKNVTWKSKNTKIATVDENGVVTGVKPGSTTIVCTTQSGKHTASCTVQVKNIIKSTKVSFAKSSYSVNHGKKITLNPTVFPSNATLRKFTWKSANTKIAKVSANGVVTGVKPGSTTITCTAVDSGKTAKVTVVVKKVSPTQVSVESKVSVVAGKTYELEAVVSPSNTTNKAVKWTSSNTNVATVDSNGVVKAKASGKTTITCTTVDGNKTAKCVVTVPAVKAKKVTLDKTSATLAVNEKLNLKATVSPSNTTSKKLKWSSSDTSVAVVNSKGQVTAVGIGEAVITCRPADGGNGKRATCKITVTEVNVIGIKLDTTSLIMDVGATHQIKGIIVPSNASDRRVIWTSSNPKVATVSNMGLVTAVGKGYCSIKATAVDGRYVASCPVYVK